jgi:hypothetical protein
MTDNRACNSDVSKLRTNMVELFVEEKVSLDAANAALLKANLPPLNDKEAERLRLSNSGKNSNEEKSETVDACGEDPLSVVLPAEVVLRAEPSTMVKIAEAYDAADYREDIEKLMSAGLTIKHASWLLPYTRTSLLGGHTVITTTALHSLIASQFANIINGLTNAFGPSISDTYHKLLSPNGEKPDAKSRLEAYAYIVTLISLLHPSGEIH